MDMNWSFSIGTSPKYNSSAMLSNHFDSLAADAYVYFPMPKYFFGEENIGIVRNCQCMDCNTVPCMECTYKIQKGKEHIIYLADEEPFIFCDRCVLEVIETVLDGTKEIGCENF